MSFFCFGKIGSSDSALASQQSPAAAGLTRRKKRDPGLPAALFNGEATVEHEAAVTTSSSSGGSQKQLKRPPSLTEEYVVQQQRREGADGLSSSDDELQPEGVIQIEIFEAASQDNKAGNNNLRFVKQNAAGAGASIISPSLNRLGVLVEDVGEAAAANSRSTNSSNVGKNVKKSCNNPQVLLAPYPLPEINKT